MGESKGVTAQPSAAAMKLEGFPNSEHISHLSSHLLGGVAAGPITAPFVLNRNFIVTLACSDDGAAGSAHSCFFLCFSKQELLAISNVPVADAPPSPPRTAPPTMKVTNHLFSSAHFMNFAFTSLSVLMSCRNQKHCLCLFMFLTTFVQTESPSHHNSRSL